jgi:hypothetical protein
MSYNYWRKWTCCSKLAVEQQTSEIGDNKFCHITRAHILWFFKSHVWLFWKICDLKVFLWLVTFLWPFFKNLALLFNIAILTTFRLFEILFISIAFSLRMPRKFLSAYANEFELIVAGKDGYHARCTYCTQEIDLWCFGDKSQFLAQFTPSWSPIHSSKQFSLWSSFSRPISVTICSQLQSNRFCRSNWILILIAPKCMRIYSATRICSARFRAMKSIIDCISLYCYLLSAIPVCLRK